MNRADLLRDLAESIGPPVDEVLLDLARFIEDQTGALEAAEAVLDHARRTADPETAGVLASVQLRAQRVLLVA